MSVTATQFADLTDTDMLADLTDVFETYASDKLKAKLYADGGVMMSNGYVDGKLYAIVLPIAYYDYIPVVSIRSDWLEECGLEAPKTMDDLWNIAKTFKDNNMGGTCTIGIGMTKNVTDVLTAGVGLLNGYHAYSNIWLEKDGKLVNSNIQPEMKAALGALAEKYSEGLIDPEFGTKENAQIVEESWLAAAVSWFPTSARRLTLPMQLPTASSGRSTQSRPWTASLFLRRNPLTSPAALSSAPSVSIPRL